MGSSGSAARARIMVAEDERIVARDLEATLVELGYAVWLVDTGAAAIATATELLPDLILMDIRLADHIDGVEAAATIKRARDVPIIFLTAHSDDDMLKRAAATAPHAYLLKPFDVVELRCSIELTLHRHQVDARLRERELWLSTTLRSIGDGVVTTDADDRITFLNPVAEAITGWSSDEVRGKTAAQVFPFVGHAGTVSADPAPGTPRTRRVTAVASDETIVSRAGGTIPIEHISAPIRAADGRVLGGVMVLRDVTERRRADDEIRRLNAELDHRVEERTQQLETSNQELAALTYSIAHELRSPLRGIAGFSEILTQDHTGGLDPEAMRLLRGIGSAANRMARLIDDILGIARLASSALVRRPIDLSALAANVIAELHASQPERRVDFQLQPDMRVDGDENLFTLALQHLLQNAWRYTATTPDARIEFGKRADDGAEVHFVKDNGVGFDMRYARKIFEDFQRLDTTVHGRSGTGVGLALVQRVIKRHGGRIWAEATVGHGAAFYFTI